MPRLELSFLGPFRATLDGKPLTGLESDKVRALLAYLAIERDKPHTRDALAALFWPERPDVVARKNLRQALTNLRAAIADEQSLVPFLSVSRDALQFNPASDCTCDVTELESSIAAARAHRHRRLPGCEACLERLSAAAALYRADLLAGFFLRDSPEFDDWVLLRREQLRLRIMEVLFELAEARLERGEFALAAQLAQRQLDLDPWREQAHRQRMTALAVLGQRSAALAQFDKCRKTLLEELGVEPEPATRRLYEQLRAGALEIESRSPARVLRLPAETTSFVGRERELAQLAEYLNNPDCRLVTLVGPGGIGKSRLAVRAARQQRHTFADGAYYVSLASITSPDLIAPAIADVCGLRLAGAEPPTAQLENYLRNKELLLVLDNFEHLVDGAELVAHLLAAAPNIVLLVTSRQALEMQSEWALAISGLPVPDEATIERSEQFAAVRLFADRARQSQPDFALTAFTRLHVARICRLVEGMPLGVELAACWSRFHTPETIASEIERGLDFLTTQHRDVPARHKSIKAVFQHSWALLEPNEKEVFRRLSVFRGGFDVMPAKSVTLADEPILFGLVSKSMLRREPNGRLGMHELLRQFAAEQLDARADERHETQARHAAYFADFLYGRTTALQGAEQQRALQEIAADMDNIRSAWRWAADNHQSLQLERALGALFYIYDLRGWLQEGVTAFGRAAARLADAAADERAALTTARLRARQGWLSFRLGEFDTGRELLEQALAVFRARRVCPEIAFALNYLGIIARVRGMFSASRAMHTESLALYRECGSAFDVARALNNLGIVVQDLGDYEHANALYAESLAIRREIGDQQGVAVALTNLGVIAKLRGDYARARSFHAQCLEIDRALQDHLGTAIDLHHLGEAAQGLGDYDAAEQLFQESLGLTREIGERFYVAATLCALAQVAQLTGAHALSQDRFRQALELAHEIGAPPLVLKALLGIAQSRANMGERGAVVELAALVRSHPAAERETREQAEGLLAKLQGEPSASPTRQLEALVAELLAK
ncbi:MAG: tetratricopeptide repeat protein [Chloroflexi bacterium]|nr:tetratricopeptide repeat protein [Chloroflexota bacterium]